MDEVKQINNDLEKPQNQPKNRSKLLGILLIIALLCIIGLAVALWWCLWRERPSGTVTPGVDTPSGVAGPCYKGESNDLPAGYTWYENAELGYKFAYPSAWGAVTLATTPMGGTAGHYAYGTFAANENALFGGNATDYVVNPRDGMPTDNPGYLQAGNRFYNVQIWSLNDPGTGTVEPQHRLYLIEEGSPTLKDGCNAKALVTQHPAGEIPGYAWDTAAFNLQPTNPYYGVNVILKNPTAESRADLDKIIRSFQLLP